MQIEKRSLKILEFWEPKYSPAFKVLDNSAATLRHKLGLREGWKVTGRGGFHHHLHFTDFEIHFWPGTGRLIARGDPTLISFLTKCIRRVGAPEIVPHPDDRTL